MISLKFYSGSQAKIYSQFRLISQMYRSIDCFISVISWNVQDTACLRLCILQIRALLSYRCFYSISSIKFLNELLKYAKYSPQRSSYEFIALRTQSSLLAIESLRTLTLFLKIYIVPFFQFSANIYLITLFINKFSIPSSVSDCTKTTQLFSIVLIDKPGVLIRMVVTSTKFGSGGRGGVFLRNKVGLQGGLNCRTQVFLLWLSFTVELPLLQVGSQWNHGVVLVAVCDFIHTRKNNVNISFKIPIYLLVIRIIPLYYQYLYYLLIIYSSHIYMRIGIIGGGIAGLGLALRISKGAQNGQQAFVRIYETNPYCGGRIHTKIVQAQCQSKQKILLDMGANLIDFQTQQSQKDWYSILPQRMVAKLQLFAKPFLIHEKNQLRKGDYIKNRYYYKGGFSSLVQDLISQLDEKIVDIKYNHEVISIRTDSIKPHLHIKDKEKSQSFQQTYDKIYISCPSPQVVSMLQGSQQNIEAQSILNYSKQIKYTKQLSVAFSTKKGIQHDFSCILFKNHPVLTFICSHQEKYNQNTYVAQISEEYSQKYFDQNENLIAKEVYESLPPNIKQFTNEKHLLVWKWPISLIKPCKNLPEIISGKVLNLIGDSLLGKSRVSNALQSTNVISSSL